MKVGNGATAVCSGGRIAAKSLDGIHLGRYDATEHAGGTGMRTEETSVVHATACFGSPKPNLVGGNYLEGCLSEDHDEMMVARDSQSLMDY